MQSPSRAELRKAAIQYLRSVAPQDIKPMPCRDVVLHALIWLRALSAGRAAQGRICSDLISLNMLHLDEAARSQKSGLLVLDIMPEALVFLTEWIHDQKHLFPSQRAASGGVITQAQYISGATQAWWRIRHTLNKYNTSSTAHYQRMMRGFSVEEAVSLFFRTHWPSLWRQKSNYGRLTQPAADDFRLMIDGKLLTVDIASSNHRGAVYGNIPMKPPADIHVLVHSDVQSNKWEPVGWCEAKQFSRGLQKEDANSCATLFFRLNCALMTAPIQIPPATARERKPKPQPRQPQAALF